MLGGDISTELEGETKSLPGYIHGSFQVRFNLLKVIMYWIWEFSLMQSWSEMEGILG